MLKLNQKLKSRVCLDSEYFLVSGKIEQES